MVRCRFQNADSRLIWIFNNYPNLYIQSNLFGTQVQSTWMSLPQSVRNNTLDYMIARWSAFPSLFYIISEDKELTLQIVKDLPQVPTDKNHLFSTKKYEVTRELKFYKEY